MGQHDESDLDARVRGAMDELELARQETYAKTKSRTVTLGNVLEHFGGAREKFLWRYSDDGSSVVYLIDAEEHEAPVFGDALSRERSAFISVPIEYIHHDMLINPRAINLNLVNLVREFAGGNPQLQQSLARIDGDYLRIFDGQHKTVARLLLGEREILLRVFLETDPAKLMETNVRAGGKLAQIGFDAGMKTRLSKSLFQERLRQYRQEHGYADDDMSFLTDELIEQFISDVG